MSTRKNFIAETIFFIIIAPLLASSLILGVFSCTDLSPEPLSIFWKVFICCVVSRIIIINKYTFFITVSLFALTGLLAVGSILLSNDVPDIYVDSSRYIREVAEYILGYRYYTPEYEETIIMFVVITIPIFITVMVSAFMFNTLAIITGFTFIMCFTSGYFSYEPAFAIYIFCILVLFIKKLNISKFSKYVEKPLITAFPVAAMPIVLVCMAAALYIPKPDNKAASEFVDSFADNFIVEPLNTINDIFNGLTPSKYFSLQSTGYLGVDNKLGGDIDATDDIVMEVISEYYVPKLVGSYKDIYTGYSWETLISGGEQFVVDDSFPLFLKEWEVAKYIDRSYIFLSNSMTVSVFDSIGGNLVTGYTLADNWQNRFGGGLETALNDMLYYSNSNSLQVSRESEKEMYIETRLNRTRLILRPQHTTGISFKDLGAKTPNLLKNNNDDLVSEDNISKNTTYKVSYFTPMDTLELYFFSPYKGVYLDTLEKLETLMKEPGYFPDENFIIYNFRAEPPSPLSLINLLRYELIPYASSVYEKYMQLPDNFPERVRELAESITIKAGNDYERAKMIEEFLRKYEYTLTPGPTPKDKDFVDYFLFELKKGYCTSFASAFVTMCRSIGIPARYVEGYIVPSERSENGNYIVTKRHGHAWGEVYFEGYGWHGFEPTPPLLQLEETEQPMPSADIESVFANQDSNMPGSSEGIIDDARNPVNNSVNELENSNALTGLSLKGKFIVSALIIILSVLSVTLARYILFAINDKRISKLENKDAVIEYFYRILKYSQFFRFKLCDDETALQYSQKTGKSFGFENDTMFMVDIAEIFTKAKYSKTPISDNERDIVKRAYESMNMRFRNNVGKYLYIYYKYLVRIV